MATYNCIFLDTFHHCWSQWKLQIQIQWLDPVKLMMWIIIAHTFMSLRDFTVVFGWGGFFCGLVWFFVCFSISTDWLAQPHTYILQHIRCFFNSWIGHYRFGATAEVDTLLYYCSHAKVWNPSKSLGLHYYFL